MYDVIVIGLGGMGGATAFELARRGRKVLGLEQYPLGHDRGSSHGQTRIIRQAYFEHPCYVPLAQRAFERWYDLEQRSGQHLFTECGCLNIGLPDGELIQGVRQSTRDHQLAVEELDASALRRRYPQLRFGDDYVALLEPKAGYLYVEDCVLAHNRQARALGAELHDEEPVLSWEASDTGISVTTVKQTYTAEKLVISAGAWAGRLLAELGLPLQVQRKTLFWYGTKDDARFRRDVFPVYLAITPEGVYYGFPVFDSHGHKMARHDDGTIIPDPAQVNRAITPADQASCRAFLAEHLPDVDGPLRHGKVCLYTLTPDRHFILDVHPRHSRVSLAAGFSGHGFKFASVVGEIMADLAETGTTRWPIEFYSLRRFGSHP